jgi:hypothetical protein
MLENQNGSSYVTIKITKHKQQQQQQQQQQQ